MPSTLNSSAAMSPEDRQPAREKDTVAAALTVIRGSRREDYDGHTEFARLSPGERLAWLEGAIRFVVASKAASRLPSPPANSD